MEEDFGKATDGGYESFKDEGSEDNSEKGKKDKFPRVTPSELTLILTTMLKRGVHSAQCECGVAREPLDDFVNEVITKVQESKEFGKMMQKWKMGLQMQTRSYVFCNILMTGIVLGSLLGNPEFLPNLPEVPKGEGGVDLESLFDKFSDEMKH